jgi:hypothetical protein
MVRCGPKAPRINKALESSDESEERTVARDMIEVHGVEASTVARENARGAALAGQVAGAKSWIRVLGLIQQRQAIQAPPIRTSADPLAGDIPNEKSRVGN